MYKGITMIIKNSQQDIHLEEDESTTTLGFKVSGGADSAIIGYMLCKYVTEERPDIKIIPITTVLEGKPYQLIYAKRVVEFLKNEFGDIFLEHQTNHASDKKYYISSQETLVNETRASASGAKNIYSGITSNPPKEVYKQWLPHTGPSDDRNGKTFPTKTNGNRVPLANIDKKGVAELYNTLGVMDTLFPITRSCEAWAKDEEYHIEKHCEDCWWCRERYWGFGRYK